MRPSNIYVFFTSIIMSCVLLATVFAVMIGFFIYRYNKGEEQFSKEVETETKTQNRDADIDGIFYLVADIESDWESLEYFLNDFDLSAEANIVQLGDITHLGVLDDFERYFGIIKKSGRTFYNIPGDRDLWKSGGLDNYSKYLGQSYYIKTIGNSKFLFIDNANEYEGISDEQFKFIEENLSDVDFVFMHNPIYFEGSPLSSIIRKGMGQYDPEVDKQRERLLQLIRDSNTKAVFGGDQHIYSESIDSNDKELKHYVVGSLNSKLNIGGRSFVILTTYKNGDYDVNKVNF